MVTILRVYGILESVTNQTDGDRGHFHITSRRLTSSQ